MSDLKFSIAGESSSATQFIGKTRQFTLVVDEPESLGGTDQDANPVEYILAGFAGCANVIGHVVAKELGFTIKKLKIEVSGEELRIPIGNLANGIYVLRLKGRTTRILKMVKN